MKPNCNEHESGVTKVARNDHSSRTSRAKQRLAALPASCCAFAAVTLLLIAGAATAADQKLILKDGSHQIVSSYEIHGDRVRFYSTERREWEEIPESLVDWKATEEAKRAAEKPPEIPADLKKPPAPPPFEVAPGIPLPDGEGVYVLDGSNLLILPQSQAEIKNDTKRSVLGSIVPGPGMVKSRAYAELPGPSAIVFVWTPNPVFYLRLSRLSPQGYGLLRAKPRDGSRVIEEVDVNRFNQNESESEEKVPAAIERLQPETDSTPGLIRLAPKELLRPGQYAIVEYVEKGKLNLFVWDFSVPSSPAGHKR